MTEIKLVVGLGNPGSEYAGTRHNIGFEVVDRLAAYYNVAFRPLPRKKMMTAVTQVEETIVTLAKPYAFMNQSGPVIQTLLKLLKLPPNASLVVHDDLDLPLGRIRLAPGGSSGGHKGVESIITALGTTGFARFRIGIGRPVGDAAGYVLSRFFPEEQEAVRVVLETAVTVVDCVLREGLDRAMNKFNRLR